MINEDLKDYKIRIRLDLMSREFLKMKLLTKRLFDENEWSRFYEKAIDIRKIFFIFQLRENQFEVLKAIGWDIKEYVPPPCDCGCCPICMELELEELKSKISKEDEEIVSKMTALREEIQNFYDTLSDSGKEYAQNMYFPKAYPMRAFAAS